MDGYHVPGDLRGTREIGEHKIKSLFSRRAGSVTRGKPMGKSHIILILIFMTITVLHGAAGIEHSASGGRTEGLAAQVTPET